MRWTGWNKMGKMESGSAEFDSRLGCAFIISYNQQQQQHKKKLSVGGAFKFH